MGDVRDVQDAQDERRSETSSPNQSFLTSLEDDELIDFINNLSQRKKQELEHRKPEEPQQVQSSSIDDNENDDDDDDEIYPDDFDDDKGNNGDTAAVFNDYASYFEHKGKAQQNEDEQYVRWEAERSGEATSTLFKGCKIHINGYTKPGRRTLHRLVILNGGKFVHYLSSKGLITHIIASRLTPRKMIEFRNYKVVKPEWITDSIKAGKLLHWSDYSIIINDYGQKRLPFEFNESDDAVDCHQNKQELQDELVALTQEKESFIDDIQIDEPVDAKHPNFLSIFFSKSRLHHLSTWKSDLRLEFFNLALDKIKRTENRSKRTSVAQPRYILHVDFDCFFATASALSHPEVDFKNTPVCVSHSGNTSNSTADIASCNYVCRKFGIRNGMWVRSAKRLCPNLVCLDYDFPAYERVSKTFYNILLNLDPDSLFPVSIDEALLDITSLISNGNTEQFCMNLRSKILESTGCTVSCGVGSNVLLAKVALKQAKPDNYFWLNDQKIDIMQFLSKIKVRDLPGVGHSIERKVTEQLFPDKDEITLKELQTLERPKLIKTFGIKTGTKLYDYARGHDDTSIDIVSNPQDFMRKSVSIDVNWGIRFENMDQVDDFLFRLGKEMTVRLQKLQMVTSSLTLKILKRSVNAPVDPPKYLGCGVCDSLSKSSRLGVPTDDSGVFGTEARSLIRSIDCHVHDLRGISIQATKLVPKNQVKNQLVLPFKKIEQKITNTPRTLLNETAPLKVTQYQIPSDMDSSIIEELPSSIKNPIKKQREKHSEPIVDVPKEVDTEVFNALPEDIQRELRDELRRRNIKIGSPKRGKNTYLQQIFPVNDSRPQYIRVISPKKSPSKRARTTSPLKAGSPTKKFKIEKYDEEVLHELPTLIRDEVIEEWKKYEDITKTKSLRLRERLDKLATENDEDDSLKSITPEFFKSIVIPITFQKRTKPKEINRLIEEWVRSTKLKGPNLNDLEKFIKYFKQLMERNLVGCVNMFQNISSFATFEKDICSTWIDIIKKLEAILLHHCREHKITLQST